MQTNRIDQLLGHKGAAIDLPFVSNNINAAQMMPRLHSL